MDSSKINEIPNVKQTKTRIPLLLSNPLFEKVVVIGTNAILSHHCSLFITIAKSKCATKDHLQPLKQMI
ncbi:hypothetical protein LDI01_12810 [Lentilactobacillus diolivorans]|uniref:Uncharacterized protein n=1 Tax=Lentilactobacillus diolivorans TaxID=179838 RepID=A0ABQ0XEA0_9LACO|nr:hypothetical protein LDI01_12810 [Lentilactobacillus diolivorans]